MPIFEFDLVSASVTGPVWAIRPVGSELIVVRTAEFTWGPDPGRMPAAIWLRFSAFIPGALVEWVVAARSGVGLASDFLALDSPQALAIIETVKTRTVKNDLSMELWV